jgi:hypothetical protein
LVTVAWGASVCRDGSAADDDAMRTHGLISRDPLQTKRNKQTKQRENGNGVAKDEGAGMIGEFRNHVLCF